MTDPGRPLDRKEQLDFTAALLAFMEEPFTGERPNGERADGLIEIHEALANAEAEEERRRSPRPEPSPAPAPPTARGFLREHWLAITIWALFAAGAWTAVIINLP
jgi:hypothetical protein